MSPRPLPPCLWPLPDTPHTHALPYGLLTEHPACLQVAIHRGLFSGTTLSFHALVQDTDPHGPFPAVQRQVSWAVRQDGRLITPFLPSIAAYRTTLTPRQTGDATRWLPGCVAQLPVFPSTQLVSLQVTAPQLAVLSQEQARVHATPSPYGGSPHA